MNEGESDASALVQIIFGTSTSQQAAVYSAATSLDGIGRSISNPAPSMFLVNTIGSEFINALGSKLSSSITPQIFRTCMPRLPASYSGNTIDSHMRRSTGCFLSREFTPITCMALKTDVIIISPQRTFDMAPIAWPSFL
jgi:hypothetical protein